MAVFYDSFESNDFSLWTTTETSGAGSACGTTNTTAHHGTYSSTHYVQAKNGYARASKTLDAGYSTIYIQARIKLGAIPNTAGQYDQLLYLNTNAGANILVLQLVRTATPADVVRIKNTVASEFYDYTATLNTGQWYLFEMELVVSAANGEAHLWIDGVEVINQTGKNTGATNCQIVKCGCMSGATAYTHTNTIDCVTVDSSQIGGDVVGYTKTFTFGTEPKIVSAVKSFTLGTEPKIVGDTVPFTLGTEPQSGVATYTSTYTLGTEPKKVSVPVTWTYATEPKLASVIDQFTYGTEPNKVGVPETWTLGTEPKLEAVPTQWTFGTEPQAGATSGDSSFYYYYDPRRKRNRTDNQLLYLVKKYLETIQ